MAKKMFAANIPPLNLAQFTNETELVIIGAAILDARLETLLRGHFDCSKANVDLLLNNRPQRSILVHCLGYLSRREFRDLQLIASIRNRYAHDVERPQFGDEVIGALAGRLSTYKASEDRRQAFIDAVERLNERLTL